MKVLYVLIKLATQKGTLPINFILNTQAIFKLFILKLTLHVENSVVNYLRD